MKNQAKHCVMEITFNNGSKLTCTYLRSSVTAAKDAAQKDHGHDSRSIVYCGAK